MRSFIKIILPYFYGDQKVYARTMGAFLVILSQMLVGCGYLFVQWNRRFYDALEAKNMDLFLWEAAVFLILAMGYVVVYSYSKYYGQQFALRWRIWMTNNTLVMWLKHLDRSKVEGADQRIQEDFMRFTAIVERFFLECFNSLIVILIFTPILFSLTQNFSIGTIKVSGLLFFTVISYTIIGMFISIKIAKPLVRIEYENQKFEAAFRYQLVHARDGEHLSLDSFSKLLAPIISNYQNLYNKQKNFNLWQKGYDQLSFLIPFIILAPIYFKSLSTLGALMQIRSTFSRLRNAMAYLLDHYTEITELQAISKRLLEFCVHIDFIQGDEKYSLSNSQHLYKRM